MMELKTRRSHEKSRGGCTRCKKQRKKCDEAHPMCTRCKKNNHFCQYAAPRIRVGSEPLSDHTLPAQCQLEIPSSGSLRCRTTSPSSSDLGYTVITPVSMSPAVSNFGEKHQTSHTLNPTELDLLSHYITHTSRVIPFDDEDLHALHVGIPNLAFGSKSVMASLLALSATCKCHDILQSSTALERLDDLNQLLALADQHHTTSLQQIRESIYAEDQVDSVLACSALMVLYGLSNHRVQVALSRIGERDGVSLPQEMLPLQSQWITLIRAAYTAYVGVLAGDVDDNSRWLSPAFESGIQLSESHVKEAYVSEDGPSDSTKSLLMPIVSATCGPALAKLRTRAQSIVSQDHHLISSSGPSGYPGLEACCTSLFLLEETFEMALTDQTNLPEQSPREGHAAASPLQADGLHRASPWLKEYMARVTSCKPSLVKRRSIMAFLNRVPMEYLQLVQSVLDCIPVDGDGTGSDVSENISSLGIVHRLALDIFAHWLVLVMHLDGVWWIGGIGQWELGRVIALVQRQGWITEYTESGQSWWPESMYKVKRELAGDSI